MTTKVFLKEKGSIYKVTNTIFMCHYKNDLIGILLDRDIDVLTVRGEIIKNHLGIWELHHNKNILDYPLNEREMNLVKKEIKKFNDYECRHCEDIFKSKGLKDVSSTQLSMF